MESIPKKYTTKITVSMIIFHNLLKAFQYFSLDWGNEFSNGEKN